MESGKARKPEGAVSATSKRAVSESQLVGWLQLLAWVYMVLGGVSLLLLGVVLAHDQECVDRGPFQSRLCEGATFDWALFAAVFIGPFMGLLIFGSLLLTVSRMLSLLEQIRDK